MNHSSSSHIPLLNPMFCMIVLSGVFLIFIGISFDFVPLKNLLNSYAADGICSYAEILNSFWLILPTTGIILIIFALVSVSRKREQIEENTLPFQYLLLLIIMTYLLLVHTRKLDNDEYEHMHNAWLMLKGILPIFSVKMIHTPLLEWITVLFLKLTGEKPVFINIMRHVIFIISLSSLYLIYIITKEIFERKSAGYMALILLTTNLVWLEISYEIRPDNIMLFFTLLSFFCFIKYLKKDKIHWLIVSFLTALVSIFGKQNALLFYLPMWLVFFCQLVFSERKLRFMYVLLGVTVLISCFSISSVREFFIINISRHLIPSDTKFWPTKEILRVIGFNPVIYILFVIQLFYYGKAGFSIRDYRVYINVSILSLFVFLFVMNRPWPQEMLVMTVVICIITGGFVGECVEGSRIGIKAVAFLALVVMIPFGMYSKKTLMKDRWRIFSQIETNRWILQLSSPEDLVFDCYGKAIFRQHPLDPDYLIYMPESFNRLSEVKSARPKFLIKDEYYSRLPKKALAWFEDNYDRIPGNSDIFVFRDAP